MQVTRYTHCMSRYVRTSREEAGLQAETQCITASASIPSRFGKSKGHKTQTARTCKLKLDLLQYDQRAGSAAHRKRQCALAPGTGNDFHETTCKTHLFSSTERPFKVQTFNTKPCAMDSSAWGSRRLLNGNSLVLVVSEGEVHVLCAVVSKR